MNKFPRWKFWDPRSGMIGGLVFGLLLTIPLYVLASLAAEYPEPVQSNCTSAEVRHA